MHGTTRFNTGLFRCRVGLLATGALRISMDRPCGIGGVAMGAWGIVGGPFKVIPTAIEISIRHHGVTTASPRKDGMGVLGATA